jgi:hypothetical protein
MKTTINLLSILILTVVMILSCNKYQSSETNKEQSGSPDMQKIESLVKYCTNRVLHGLKTNDSIPIDSIAFYLNATSNYTYGISSAHGDSQLIDSNYFTVPYKNKKAALHDVDSIYSAMIDSIRVSYYTLQNQNKNLAFVMVSIANKQSNKINFKAVYNIIYGNMVNPGTFDTTDYWLWWNWGTNSGGKCGPYSGYTSLDAAIKIQQHVMLNKGAVIGCYVPPLSQYNFYATDWPNPHHNYNDGPCYFFYYFYCNYTGDPCYHACLWPFEMNRYLSGAEHVCYTSVNQSSDPGAKPDDGESFMSIYLTGDFVIGIGPNDDLWLHKGIIYYGTYIPCGSQTRL